MANSKRISKKEAAAKPTEGAVAYLHPCVVGIGASAGGFDAIRNFFRSMPSDSGVAFVVVQHMDPSHVSLAAELFAKCTPMSVSEAKDNELIEANHVYTSPSDKEVSVRNGRLSLAPRHSHAHLQLPIDHFFNSLGNDLGVRAIGIVLSGTGSDGTLGLKTIATQGGIVLVQEPATAQFDGMPLSAIGARIANYVLPVEKMPAVIVGYAKHPYADGLSEDTDVDGDPKVIQAFVKILLERCGYDFSGYKIGTLQRRILRRMSLHGILNKSAYIALLQKDPAEVDALFRDLLIGVTEFIRDPEAWSTLDAEVISPLVARKNRDEPIRIWIPGCSTGEEAYTMAMMVLDRLRRSRKRCPVQIFATDTNNEALNVGRLGHYPVGIAARIPAAQLGRYFAPAANHQNYVVRPELRACVVFGVQNLFADPPFGRVDLISCRNVLIYLESAVQKRVLDIFHFALSKDGCLFLGSAESNSGRDDLFKPISKKWRIFGREGAGRSDLLSLPVKVGEVPVMSPPVALPAGLSVSQVAGVAQKLILDRFAPAAVLINVSNEVLYFCGPTDEFLMRPRGAPTQDILAMAREGLRSRLRVALKEAIETGLSVTASGARMRRTGGFSPVQITITPAPGGNLGRLFLVVFRHERESLLVPAPKGAAGTLVRHLEEELQATRDDLQNTIERFESGSENLRVSNEEVVTTNEELRSLNEELESSKEELQSLNEELTTANQELEVKVRELETANSDLQNLLNSNDIATICLDQDLCIKWFTPATKSQFRFMGADVGRPISAFSLPWDKGGLLEAAQVVLTNRTPNLTEFESGSGQSYIRRILPYLNEHQQISGVIVTYTDISALRSATQEIDTARQDLTESRRQHEKLRSLSAALAMAEERERRALARDLHDDLGQVLAVVALKAAELKKLPMEASLQRAVEDCSRAVNQANRKLRAMAFQLSPPILQDLGLAVALQWVADEMHQVYKLDVQVSDDGVLKPLEPAVSTTLFRAVRELLINVAKHAKVSTATLRSEVQRHQSTEVGDVPGTLVVTVTDNGSGFDPSTLMPAGETSGFGLFSVQERLSLLGGEVTVVSNPGVGTSVVLKVPLRETK